MIKKRTAGILMPIFSLPSQYGIGTLGKEAYKFIDFLKAAGQSYWQMLPIGPTSYGDSPYQSFSTFAGNPYFIDLDELIKEGLLEEKDIKTLDWGDDASKVDYGKVYQNRGKVLFIAARNGLAKASSKSCFEEFVKAHPWTEEYGLYMAIKTHFGMVSWQEWPDSEIRMHQEEAICKYRELLKDEIEIHKYVQYLFYSQWVKLREYASSSGIKLIGDIPIYVPIDSSDVWANKEFFALDEEGQMKEVAGCPPDAFSVDGQLWGNPLYNWERMKEDGYGWWIRRIGGAAELFDVIRIDHFRGFDSYYAIPFGEKTAVNGQWKQGPGMDFVGRMTGWFGETEFIAEDLGFMTDSVVKLLKDSGLPGMKVMQFAFDDSHKSGYLPHNHSENSLCYLGTHDNETLMGWIANAPKSEIEFAKEYFNVADENLLPEVLLRAAHASVAKLFVAQMQDYLKLGNVARINTPGTLGTNWQWRIGANGLTDQLSSRIKKLTQTYGRI